MSFNLSGMTRFLKGAAIALFCAVVLFAQATPALAIGSMQSRPSEGEPRLNEILDESEDAIRPENALDADKIIEQANKGLNEVQGTADIHQMNRPSNSRQAKSAAEEVQQALGKAADKMTGRN
ncbi:MAG: hypothetical protein KME07_16220 [Pegethrix bostrychoides GSE-TBD4-15B]|jgi:DNA polymerase II large subunit|uniref:Low temperature-induced protein n=1 Tax=Pegethrix bostrychoides GSE-TBD4-15B TaxID=2839662 RepID=A0A951PDB3_9CYAN|nr:hypothetical protein [Pegethrix bostrychoides GSE-TBD4-15B]